MSIPWDALSGFDNKCNKTFRKVNKLTSLDFGVIWKLPMILFNVGGYMQISQEVSYRPDVNVNIDGRHFWYL